MQTPSLAFTGDSHCLSMQGVPDQIPNVHLIVTRCYWCVAIVLVFVLPKRVRDSSWEALNVTTRVLVLVARTARLLHTCRLLLLQLVVRTHGLPSQAVECTYSHAYVTLYHSPWPHPRPHPQRLSHMRAWLLLLSPKPGGLGGGAICLATLGSWGCGRTRASASLFSSSPQPGCDPRQGGGSTPCAQSAIQSVNHQNKNAIEQGPGKMQVMVALHLIVGQRNVSIHRQGLLHKGDAWLAQHGAHS
jgi:hypothetical protein